MLVAAVVMGHVVMIYIKDGPDKLKKKRLKAFIFVCLVSIVFGGYGLTQSHHANHLPSQDKC